MDEPKHSPEEEKKPILKDEDPKFTSKDFKSRGHFRDHNRHQYDQGGYRNNKFQGPAPKPEALPKGGANDVAWYKHNPKLLASSSNLPFGNILGLPLDLIPAGKSDVGTAKLTIPGICVIKLVSSVGYSRDAGSNINVAARDIYSWVRHKNSGHTNYESADLMMYLMGLAQLYSFIGWMLRCYAVVNYVTATNRYTQKCLAHAMGLNFEDLNHNQVLLKNYIGTFCARVLALSAPKSFSLFKKYFWIYTGVYTDSTSNRAQMYLFSPSDFKYYKWDTTNGGSLVSCNSATEFSNIIDFSGDVSENNTSVSDIMDYGDKLLNKMLVDEDCGIISGDIRKAYDELFTLSFIPDGYVLKPEFNEEILWMIHNMRLVPYEVANANITQDGNVVIQNMVHDFTRAEGSKLHKYAPFSWDWVVDSRSDVPSSDEVVTSTRLAPATMSYWSTNSTTKVETESVQITGCDTFLPVKTYFYTIDQTDFTLAIAYEDEWGSSVVPTARNASAVTQFDYHPIIMKADDLSTSGKYPTLVGLVADLDNVTIISRNTLEMLHNACVMSEFEVPVTGSF